MDGSCWIVSNSGHVWCLGQWSWPGLAIVFSSLHHPALKRLHTFALDHSPLDRFSLSSAFTFDFVIAFSFTSLPSICLSFPLKKCVCVLSHTVVSNSL